jgi:hypothetical protein
MVIHAKGGHHPGPAGQVLHIFINGAGSAVTAPIDRRRRGDRKGPCISPQGRPWSAMVRCEYATTVGCDVGGLRCCWARMLVSAVVAWHYGQIAGGAVAAPSAALPQSSMVWFVRIIGNYLH